MFRDITQRRATDRALQRSEQDLRDFFEKATVGLHWVGPDGIILRANQTELDMLGYSREEYVGRHVADFHADPDVAGDILRCLATGEVLREYPARLRCKDGSIKYVLINSNVLWEDGKFIHTRCFTRDITEHKLAEEHLRQSEARKTAMFEAALDCIISIDREGTIIEFNAAAERTFGHRREDVLGRELAAIIIPPNYREPHRNGLARYLATGEGPVLNQRLELSALRASGEEFPVELTVTRIPLDGPPTFTAYLRDITDRKRMEEELRLIAANLSEADRRKNEFLAMLAHELRNPLAPIRNAAQIVKLTQGKGEASQSASEMMERQIGQMVRLVDDLLDVSRITRGTIDLRCERVELASVVYRAVETSRPAIESAKHQLTVTLPEQPIYLNADPMRLAQVFGNLLNNSCKYSEPEARISITAERQGSDVVVSVKDTGVGIPADMLPRIFEMFTQVDRSLERAQGGLGIGLTLVERLVEAHGGSVDVKSEGPGQGSEFIVRLPVLIETPKPTRVPTAGEQKTASPRRILIVDDNRDAATTLGMLLRLSGNETHEAYDGVAAVEAADKIRPDVVLLDIGLPKLNGYEVARKLREQPWGRSIAIVALTGWGQDEDREKSREAGFDAHLVKPVDHTALTKLLAEFRIAESAN